MSIQNGKKIPDNKYNRTHENNDIWNCIALLYNKLSGSICFYLKINIATKSTIKHNKTQKTETQDYSA